MRRFAVAAVLLAAMTASINAFDPPGPKSKRLPGLASGTVGQIEKNDKLAPTAVSLGALDTAVTENFDGIGNTATATLPSSWKVDSVSATQTTNYANAAASTIQAAGTSGTGIVTSSSGGGTYNFANGVTATSTDRAIGWLTSGSYLSPRQLFAQFTNNTGATITSLDISYDIEKYRSGSRAYTISFFSSDDGSTWTARTAGDQSYAADAANTTVFNPPAATNKSFTITGLSIASGSTFYLRWAYTGNGGSTNAQGLGIDNFSITPHGAVATPGTLEFSSATYSGSEHGGSIALTVTRTGGSSGSVGATVTQTDGTATGGTSLCNPSSGDDYTKATYAVLFADGQTSATVSIPVCNDVVDETDETFTATLGSVSGGATLGSQSAATVTIIDDDWTVTSAADTNDGLCDTDCSLREAIAGAASGDAIRFSPLFDSAQTITVASQLQITKPLTITGPGANLLTINATGNDGAFYISTSAGQTTTLSGMTITGSDTTAGVGGAIKSYGGALILDGVHIKNSSASFAGGGVYIEQSNGNVIRRSTFSGNGSNRCGGLLVFLGSATIENTTFSGNSSATGVGGGLCAEFNSALTVRNSTVTNNSASTTGGGIEIESGSTLNIGSTIVAANNAVSGQPEIQNNGVTTSAGYNLIGDAAGDATDTVNAIVYQSTDITNTNPMLQPLGYYFGGKIPTHSLYLTSPAFDHGSSFGLTTDALGHLRVIDHPDVANTADGADIGAVESLAPTAAATSVSGRVRTESGAGIANARVTISGPGLSEPITVITNNFGNFRFDQIQAGQTYVVTVSAKRYTFLPPSRSVSVQQDVTGLDFTAER